MSGEGGSVDDRSMADVAASMRKLLDATRAGDVPSTPTSRHYLATVIAALDAVAHAPLRA